MFRILKLSSCNHIHSSFSALSFSDCCNLCFFIWSSWSASIANLLKFYDSYNYFYDFRRIKRNVTIWCSIWYVTQFVLIKSSKTNTNCGLDNDRKDNVTTQILRITFCRKLHSLELIKNQAYTCISLTLQFTPLLNSPKRFSDMMTFL